MYKYTTPTHVFKFTVDPSELSKIVITYAQRGRIVLEKHKNDLEFIGNNKAQFRFTQEESGKFLSNVPTSVQVRVLFSGGESFASKVMAVGVLPVLKSGVLEANDG